jgi:hypothetical protein
MLDQSALNPEEKFTLAQLWQPAITREEVFFTGKENIEGFVCLLSYFLPQMISKDVDYPALINIDNHDFDDEEDTRAGQLFFQSVINFKDTFTKNLPRHVRNKVKTITLKVDFNNIPTPVNVAEVQQKICVGVFDNLGLTDTVYVSFPKQQINQKE